MSTSNVLYAISKDIAKGLEKKRLYLKIFILKGRWEKSLKAHRQISKKRCFEKYCSCDQACQFSALQVTP